MHLSGIIRCVLPGLGNGNNTLKKHAEKNITDKPLKTVDLYSADMSDILQAAIIGAGFTMITAYLFYENFLALILLSPLGILCAKRQLSAIRHRKVYELRTQFKDAMMAVSFSLNVGYSLENSFSEALHELRTLYSSDSMIVKEFSIIVNRIGRNEKLENVLYDFAQKSEIDDIRYFAEVFKYARTSGGDMISIIKNTVRTISEKIETENEIQVVISAKKMEQKIMSVVPFIIIGYLKLTSADFIAKLYNNIAGVLVMSVCLILYIAAVGLSKKIVDISI